METDILGHTTLTTSPLFRGNAGPEVTAWADMLSMIGQRNGQLLDVINNLIPRESRPRTSGNAILRELERERSRIARELHAGAGQPLAGIKLNLELLDRCAMALPQQGRDAVARLQTLTAQALEQVRAVSHSLHPPEWQNLTTAEAVRQLIDSSGVANFLAVEARIDSLPVEPSHAVKVAIYRCTQECIANIVRHSGATGFGLWLHEKDSMLELQVEDDGHGFDPEIRRDGIGLSALREHADAFEGRCDITTGPGGTKILIQIPLMED